MRSQPSASWSRKVPLNPNHNLSVHLWLYDLAISNIIWLSQVPPSVIIPESACVFMICLSPVLYGCLQYRPVSVPDQTDPRHAGIEVEVIVPPAKESPRIEEAEDLGALALFQLYADTVEMSPEARSKGLSILEVGSPVTTEGQPPWTCDARSLHNKSHKPVVQKLHRVPHRELEIRAKPARSHDYL